MAVYHCWRQPGRRAAGSRARLHAAQRRPPDRARPAEGAGSLEPGRAVECHREGRKAQGCAHRAGVGSRPAGRAGRGAPTYADRGERFWEFFTANIRNRNTQKNLLRDRLAVFQMVRAEKLALEPIHVVLKLMLDEMRHTVKVVSVLKRQLNPLEREEDVKQRSLTRLET
jgi:hypothetical protein